LDIEQVNAINKKYYN